MMGRVTSPRLYFDWNATTPPLPEALEAMHRAAREAWGNPSSAHAEGRAARARLEEARVAVAALVGARPYDVIFTSGGTEASNLALQSSFDAAAPADGSGRHALLLAAFEHHSVLAVAAALASRGIEVRHIRVGRDGRIDLADAEAKLADGRVRQVAIMAVNGETGVVQPHRELALIAHARGAAVHLDAIQAVGRLSPPERGWLADVDTLALAAHKIRGPKGIGALVTQPGHPLRPLLLGGGQERGLRPGTQDAVLAAGFAVAARHAVESVAGYAHVAAARDRLEAGLLAFPGVVRNGDAARVPHVVHVSVRGWDSASLVAALDLEGVAVSGGPACAAGHPEPSSTMRAMWGDAPAEHWRYEAPLRWSLPPETTHSEVDIALERFARVRARRTSSGT
jgi:cysteine desulfurase